jgi:hypothetical protein
MSSTPGGGNHPQRGAFAAYAAAPQQWNTMSFLQATDQLVR